MTSRGTVGRYLRELNIDELAGPIPKYVTHVLLYGLEPHDLKKFPLQDRGPDFCTPSALLPLSTSIFFFYNLTGMVIYTT